MPPDCNYNFGREHPLINESNKHKYNFGEVKNYHTEFLVLLNKEDLLDNSIFWFNKSIKTKLLKKKNKFPGKLNIIAFNEIENDKEYIIEDIPLPNEIYMKLPNNNLYVLSSKYNLEYFNYKQSELLNIFVLLGAKKIIIKNINKIGYMVFDYDEKIMNNIHPEMFSHKNFFFLPKEHIWQDIIIRRLEKNLIKDKHTFRYTSHLFFNPELERKLEIMNINFRYYTEDFDNFQTIYEIEYYKLKNKDEKIDDTVVIC